MNASDAKSQSIGNPFRGISSSSKIIGPESINANVGMSRHASFQTRARKETGG